MVSGTGPAGASAGAVTCHEAGTPSPAATSPRSIGVAGVTVQPAGAESVADAAVMPPAPWSYSVAVTGPAWPGGATTERGASTDPLGGPTAKFAKSASPTPVLCAVVNTPASWLVAAYATSALPFCIQVEPSVEYEPVNVVPLRVRRSQLGYTVVPVPSPVGALLLSSWPSPFESHCST